MNSVNTLRDGMSRKSLALRIGAGVLIAYGTTVAARARENWETGGEGVAAPVSDDIISTVIAGGVAGIVFHFVRGSGTISTARYYLAWMLAATFAAVPILLPDVRSEGQWSLLLGALIFGVLAGGGWAIFLRRLAGHDL